MQNLGIASCQEAHTRRFFATLFKGHVLVCSLMSELHYKSNYLNYLQPGLYANYAKFVYREPVSFCNAELRRNKKKPQGKPTPRRCKFNRSKYTSVFIIKFAFYSQA